ncbi:universal stress protein [Edaphobacter modestus]|uniref:universal stress protein n=1 Tax=Edaphobacter modestus TaxID=388466 RepID=UPI00102CE088
MTVTTISRGKTAKFKILEVTLVWRGSFLESRICKRQSFSDRSKSGLATREIVFTRIVVATDFSKPAARALKLAISVGQMFGSKISLVHAASLVVDGIDASALSR